MKIEVPCDRDGENDFSIAAVDGLTGFPDAINLLCFRKNGSPVMHGVYASQLCKICPLQRSEGYIYGYRH